MKNWAEKVFDGIPAGPEEADLVRAYLTATDLAAGSRRGFAFDLRKLAAWFVEANKEPFRVARVTTRDVTDFRDYLRREKGLAVATVNRALVMVRRYFGWLAEHGHVLGEPAEGGQGTEAGATGPEGDGAESGAEAPP
ncbi:MAG TPA: site-specific integrase [Fimbriiglobus sp.]|nr:site-specific integrase [Fimbriiglobus sp.]